MRDKQIADYDLKSRYDTLVMRASELSGIPASEIEKSRQVPTLFWRYSIFVILRNEGYPLHAIGSVSHKNHATVYHSTSEMSFLLQTNRSAISIYAALTKDQQAMYKDKIIFSSVAKIRTWLETHSTLCKQEIDKLMEKVNMIRL